MVEIGTTSWKEIYERARQESDKEKLGELVLAAESAIYRRYQEIESSANHHDERRSMQDATDYLLALKVNQLGWPPVS
jgi:proteasome lid subunit RPN8/RPN11